MRWGGALLLVLLGSTACLAEVDNVVVSWNSALQRTIRKLSIANQISSRYLTLLHVAQYQALVEGQRAGRDDLEDAVAAFAAHRIVSYYFPNEQTQNYDRLIQTQVAGFDEQEISDARTIAFPVAASLITSRIDDGSQDWAQFRFAPNNTVGAYQATPGQAAALYPQLANTTTFVTPLASDWYPTQFSQLQPAQVGTEQYDREYQAVKYYGNANTTTTRDSYQQETPYFWADDVNTAAITGHWNNITAFVLPSNTSLLETAELFAKLQVSFYDSNIQGWYIKYATLHWRPVTAVRQGDPLHEAVPTWFPLLNTPGHPEFPSTHSISSGAAAAVLARFFGTDNITFEIGSEYPNQVLVPRRYTSFSDAAIEIANSRVYGGIHFPASGPIGLQVGAESGNYVYENFGKLTPEGGPAPTAGEEVQLRYSDGSFAEVQVPQPQPGELAPGPAPTLNATKLATQISSAPALPPTAGSALAPSPTSSS